MKVAQVLLFAWVVVFAFWAVRQVMRANQANDKKRKALLAPQSGEALADYKSRRNTGA